MNLLQVAHGLARGASEDLLRSIDRSVKGQQGADIARLLAQPEAYAAALIEFAGEAISGSVLFLSDFRFFAGRLPSRKRATALTRQSARDWLQVRDVCMELTNQLLGRVTNQLYRIGVTVEPLLPVALSGPAIRVVVGARKQAPLVYSADGHPVFIWFEVTAKEGASTRPGATPLAEGDFVQF